MTITREKALELLNKYVTRENLKKHCLATGMVMKALARYLGEDEELWEVTGILHDIDVEHTTPEEHTSLTERILMDLGAPQEMINAIVAHNDLRRARKRESKLDFALASGENLTGLVVASALVLPEKKLSNLSLKSLKKRFKEKRFASGVKRDVIKECERLGIPLDKFLEIGLEAMKEGAEVLGL